MVQEKTHQLGEQNSASTRIITEYQCNNTVIEMIQNNLLPERKKFSIHVEE